MARQSHKGTGMPPPLILIVDDDPAVSDALAEALQRAGLRTLQAWPAVEALQVAPLHKPEIVLLDVMLPGLDGLEVAKRLRAAATAEPPSIVIMTGSPSSAVVEAAFAIGCDDFLNKPFQREALLRRLEWLLTSAAGGKPAKNVPR